MTRFPNLIWWLLTDRTYEVEDDDGLVTESVSVGFREGWALIRPYPFARFLREMDCGCERLPWRGSPSTIQFDCPSHGVATLGLAD